MEFVGALVSRADEQLSPFRLRASSMPKRVSRRRGYDHGRFGHAARFPLRILGGACSAELIHLGEPSHVHAVASLGLHGRPLRSMKKSFASAGGLGIAGAWSVSCSD